MVAMSINMFTDLLEDENVTALNWKPCKGYLTDVAMCCHIILCQHTKIVKSTAQSERAYYITY